jgi:tRNA 2-selenouridine synthase
MPIKRLHIEEFLAGEGPVIDVRSPGEYNHAHIPGAVNIPLFSDEERKVVGTAYKQQSRELAIKHGLDFFGPKMRKMVEKVEALNTSSRPLNIYCWRGGMRSGAVAWLMDLYGFKVNVLAGGYKSYRHLTLKTFEQPFSLKILGGYTGSGKTELLQAMHRQGQPVIDLEELASHKGSAFGSIGMPKQPSQEMFENRLAQELRKLKEREIWLEDESQRIGDVNVPIVFWQLMRQSPLYFLDIPFEKRLEHLVDEYEGCDTERLRNGIERITKRLGGLETKNALEFLSAGNLKECFRILLKYYDKHYLKGLHNRTNLDSLLSRISCSSVSDENWMLLPDKHQIV